MWVRNDWSIRIDKRTIVYMKGKDLIARIDLHTTQRVFNREIPCKNDARTREDKSICVNHQNKSKV